jgi:hypothetical protein
MWPFTRPRPERTGDVFCSFCGKSRDEVRKVIAGPTVYICDECIDLCNDIIAEECDQEDALGGEVSPVASLDVPRSCRVCRLPKPTIEVMSVPEVGFVCQRCIAAIRVATDGPAPKPSGA